MALTPEGTAHPEADEPGPVHAQSLMREVNEQIHQLRSSTFFDSDVRSIICECTSVACMEQIEVALDRYQEVRRFPTRFLLVPGHEDPATERLVEQQSGYVIVEKTGVDGEVASRLDPRRRRQP